MFEQKGTKERRMFHLIGWSGEKGHFGKYETSSRVSLEGAGALRLSGQHGYGECIAYRNIGAGKTAIL